MRRGQCCSACACRWGRSGNGTSGVHGIPPHPLGVVAEVVAAFHELVRLYGKSLLFAEAALGIEAFVLLVNASYNLPDDSLFLAQIIMEIGTLHGLFFGDARTETVLGKAYGQGVQAVVGTGTRRFGESLLQGGFNSMMMLLRLHIPARRASGVTSRLAGLPDRWFRRAWRRAVQDRTVWSPGGTWLRVEGEREYCSSLALSAECRRQLAGSISRQGGRHGRGILRLLPVCPAANCSDG